jgi:hypothetical protein
VVVANARRLRLIAEHDTKNDRTDAETLARLGRVDPALLAPIRHRGRATQADLAVVRARDAVVRVRTLLVNHVRGAVKAVGARVPACSTPAFARRAQPAVPEELVPALGAVFGLLEELNRVIRGYDRAVAARCARAYPETTRLTQVAGVGPLTALAYVLTLEDPARFPRPRAVGAYLGLSPKQASSGQRTPQLRITKAGDGMLRRLLVGSAHYILGPFGPTAICAGGGSASRRAEERTPRNARWWRWPASWRSCSTACGRRARPTTRCGARRFRGSGSPPNGQHHRWLGAVSVGRELTQRSRRPVRVTAKN